MLHFPLLKKKSPRLLAQSLKFMSEQTIFVFGLHEEKVHKIIFHMTFIEWFYLYFFQKTTPIF